MSLGLSREAVGPVPARDVAASVAGIGLTVLGVLLFAGCNALSKWLVATYPVGEMLFVRSVSALLVLVPFIALHEWATLRTDGQWRLHLVRVLFSALEVGCFYWALSGLPLAETSTIYLAAPIYLTGLSALFLGERVGWRRWAAVVVGFAGVLVALRPAGEVLSPHALVAFGGSLLYAVSLVVTRRQRATSNTVLVATQIAAVMLLCSATAPFGWVMPGLGEAGLLALLGVVSMLGYLCVNRGLQLAQASAVAPFQYTSIVWAVVLGFLVFGDVPAPATLAGAGIIVAAGLFILLRERTLARHRGDSNFPGQPE